MSHRLYNCGRCHTRHPPPTGSKCEKFIPGDVSDVSDDSDDPEVTLNKTVIPAQTQESNSTSMEDRMDNLERMLFKLSDNVMLLSRDSRHVSRHRSSSVSSTDSTSDDHHHSSRSRSPSKLDTKFSYDAIFLDDDYKVTNFADVMLALFKTFYLFIEEGLDTTGLIAHGHYLAEKAAADVYVSEAFVHFDKYTRALAARKGHEAFGKLSELDRNRYFSIENYRDVRAFRGKMKAGNGKSKTTGICHRFNSDSGCTNKPCPYTHKCAMCDIFGHSAKDCRVIRKKELPSK